MRADGTFLGEWVLPGSNQEGVGLSATSLFISEDSGNVVDDSPFSAEFTPRIPGDANDDGAVDLQDFGLLKANFGTTSGATWGQGDFNGDGAIDLQDFGLLKANFGTGGEGEAGGRNIPEPATLFVMTAAGLPMLLRRRRGRNPEPAAGLGGLSLLRKRT